MKFTLSSRKQFQRGYFWPRLRNISLSVKCIALLCLMQVFSSAQAKTAEEAIKQAPGADIRMLIDISGSMKKNDPANLRIPAVNLLTELIPDGDHAGVWTFGQWVNNLIKSKAVDDEWRVDAKEKAKQINSVALFTNIGAALEKSADDFYKKDKDFSNTHFILLTDGMVDIDKDPAKNATERDKILTSLLNTFKEKGAKIHTVSLSKNADQALMEKLAVQTGGQSALAEKPEDLTKIFLQALDQAVPVEQVPLEGNEFVIDSSIEEFTALLFRKEGSAPAEIVSPDESVYTYANQGEDIKWYQDAGYDLITVTRPLEGTWKINADILPDSRVTVVSNLQLNVTKLPVNFFAGDPLDVEVSFSEDGNRITRPEFLTLLDIQLQLTTEDNKSARKSMSEGQESVDGVFRESINKLSKIGQYEVSVLVDGKTFKRKKRQVINLRAPFDFEFAVRGEGDQAYYELVVSPMNESISTKDTNIFAKINAPDGSSLINALELDEENNRWVMPIRNDKGDGLYQVSAKVKAETVSGKKFKFKPEPFEAEFPIPAGASNAIVSKNKPEEEEEALPEEVLAPEPKEEPKEEKEEEKIEEKTAEETKAAPEPEIVKEEIETSDETVDLVEEDDNAIWLIVGAGALAAIMIIGGAVFYFMRKRKASNDSEEEVLSDQDVEEISEEIAESEPEDEGPENDGLDFVEEPPEDVPVLDEVDEPEPEAVSEVPDELPEIEDDEFDEPLVDIEEDDLADEVPVVEEAVVEELAVKEPVVEVSDEELDEDEVDLELPDEVADIDELLDQAVEEDDIVDLSSDDLSDVVDELEQEEFDESLLEDAEDAVDEEDLAADIAQAIEDAADEPEDDLDKEIEEALDINEDDDDDDDDDEEFNLEDFDIGDTDDLVDDDDKK